VRTFGAYCLALGTGAWADAYLSRSVEKNEISKAGLSVAGCCVGDSLGVGGLWTRSRLSWMIVHQDES
jgi:hypothetical protein